MAHQQNQSMFSNVKVNVRRQTSESQKSTLLIDELHHFYEKEAAKCAFISSEFEFKTDQLHGIEGFPVDARKKSRKKKYKDEKTFIDFTAGATGCKSEYDLNKR